MNILFVCTGNICRSPVAEYLLRGLTDNVVPECSIASAGVIGLSEHPMDPRSLEYLRQRGINGSSFTARRINRRILQESDLIVGFESMHLAECLTVFPTAWPRAFRLSELAQWHRSGALETLEALPKVQRYLPPVRQNIPDPVQLTSYDDYSRVLDAISSEITTLAAMLPGSPAEN